MANSLKYPKLLMSTSAGKIREASLFRKQFCELKGEELMGRTGCPIFYRPLKVESHMIMKKNYCARLPKKKSPRQDQALGLKT